VEKFLTLKFEEELKDPENRTEAEKEEANNITGARIGAVISVVFEKAIDEPSFASSYAKMVKNSISYFSFSQVENISRFFFILTSSRSTTFMAKPRTSPPKSSVRKSWTNVNRNFSKGTVRRKH